MRVLVTGATGYVGGRLAPWLVEAGHEVTVLVRSKRRYAGRPGAGLVRMIEGDLLAGDLGDRLTGFDAAYYLVHSMLGGRGFESRDREAASRFAGAVGSCPHVIYLGGLLPAGAASLHLRSRAETGDVLRELLAGRVTEFRAGPVIGSGSASFEMVRYLTERLPVMLTPRWVRNEVSPIAIRDVLSYLLEALRVGPAGVVEIGCEALTFRAMMEVYAEVRGLRRRWIVPAPVLAPGLAARWVGFVTPIPNRLAVPLVRGLVQPLVADTSRARALYPGIVPIAYRQAVTMALGRTEKNMVDTRWSGSLGTDRHTELVDQEGLIREVRQVQSRATPAAVFASFTSAGGDKGWWVWNWAWRVRGWLDKLAGGPGLRRGRRDPQRLLEGEAVDFWRVERIEPGLLLRLRAEMKLPGRAWLQWEVEPLQPGEGDAGSQGSRITQTAIFEPKGVLGWLYWWSLWPVHRVIFGAMIRAIAREADQRQNGA